jgi:hypothetical protein
VPKELKEIRTFQGGVIFNADEADIPDEHPSYAINIDSRAPSGTLQGIEADKHIYQGTANLDSIYAFEDKGIKYLLALDKKGNNATASLVILKNWQDNVNNSNAIANQQPISENITN